jgi:hypothetical protein
VHLDSNSLDPYMSRSLDAPRLHAFDEHLGTCLQCLLLVEAASLDPDRWERRGILGRLVHVTPPAAPPAERRHEQRQAA